MLRSYKNERKSGRRSLKKLGKFRCTHLRVNITSLFPSLSLSLFLQPISLLGIKSWKSGFIWKGVRAVPIKCFFFCGAFRLERKTTTRDLFHLNDNYGGGHLHFLLLLVICPSSHSPNVFLYFCLYFFFGCNQQVFPIFFDFSSSLASFSLGI